MRICSICQNMTQSALRRLVRMWCIMCRMQRKSCSRNCGRGRWGNPMHKGSKGQELGRHKLVHKGSEGLEAICQGSKGQEPVYQGSRAWKPVCQGSKG